VKDYISPDTDQAVIRAVVTDQADMADTTVINAALLIIIILGLNKS
jgi:hypothetical protein